MEMGSDNHIFLQALLNIVHGYLSGDEFSKERLHSREYREAVKYNFERESRRAVEECETHSSGVRQDLSAEDNEAIDFSPPMQLIIKDKNEASDAIQQLKEWLRDAKCIDLVDTYLMHYREGNLLYKKQEKYIESIISIIPHTVKKLIYMEPAMNQK